MRISFVQAGFGAGGAEKVVSMLAHHYRQRGDSVEVIALNEPSGATYFDYDPAISVVGLAAPQDGSRSRPRRLFDPVAKTLALRHRFAVTRPDIVLSFLTKVNIVTALAAARLAIPVVMSERNNFVVQPMHPAWRAMRSLAQARSARLVMQTQAAREALPRHLRRKASVIPNPVAPAPLTATKDDPSHVIAVGRLDRQKGFDRLLDAFAIVHAAMPDARLTIFGEGQERAALERQITTLGLESRVVLPGVTHGPQDWISAGGIFVLSSRYEGFPNVLLEALAAGLPLVATACPWGPSEILADVADIALAQPDEPEDLAAKLLHLSRNDGARARLRAIGPVIAERYLSAAVFAKWDAVIDGVTGSA
ncbi:glycosyltransferase family 4 protein [Jiella sp. MQZ9-1]|uniref:Glycosyltransferase family 4 protein n=1 Tax=Jiella flava TaxID=2816857 RepID=A0A939FZF3_9HYPH|nr:glycosyltransferase family 4 protein [Jiella flava]MBO0663026.1 glycosyltransferase family 4 protein [Jiella flava]MCD2471445.1 glycosyltransferase family 4 protein [Jiella flava]